MWKVEDTVFGNQKTGRLASNFQGKRYTQLKHQVWGENGDIFQTWNISNYFSSYGFFLGKALEDVLQQREGVKLQRESGSRSTVQVQGRQGWWWGAGWGWGGGPGQRLCSRLGGQTGRHKRARREVSRNETNTKSLADGLVVQGGVSHFQWRVPENLV